MRLFPKIEFVDEIPLKCHIDLPPDQAIVGFFGYHPPHIWVLKGEKQYLVLLHELGHWCIRIFTKSKKIQIWYDKKFTVVTKRGEREKRQNKVRKEYRDFQSNSFSHY